MHETPSAVLPVCTVIAQELPLLSVGVAKTTPSVSLSATSASRLPAVTPESVALPVLPPVTTISAEVWTRDCIMERKIEDRRWRMEAGRRLRGRAADPPFSILHPPSL